MRKKIFLTATLILSVAILNEVLSQKMVQRPAFNTMLKSLLDHSVPERSVNQVKQLIDKGNTKILDAREKDEYSISHLRNSIWVGYNDFSIERLEGISKDDTIVVYCSVGYRSEKICEKLIALGYKHVFNTYGGIFEWVNRGNTVVNNENQEMQKVHTYNKTWGVWLQKGIKVH